MVLSLLCSRWSHLLFHRKSLVVVRLAYLRETGGPIKRSRLAVYHAKALSARGSLLGDGKEERGVWCGGWRVLPPP